MTTIYPSNFRLALDSRAMSVSRLAKASGIPIKRLRLYASDLGQRYLAYQLGGHEIPEDELEIICAWLHYPPSFFSGRVIEQYPAYFCDHGWV